MTGTRCSFQRLTGVSKYPRDTIYEDHLLNSTAGYDAFFAGHSGVTPLAVDVPDFADSLGPALIDALETALRDSKQTVRALVLANPHNPLGRCYSVEVLKRCIQFCEKHNIHLVSDEVFALSEFECPDLVDAPGFTSVLSIDLEALGADEKRVHVTWSLSKDFAASGVRLVSA
jgi:aspartate/methionine/tyrosine aminotransferase